MGEDLLVKKHGPGHDCCKEKKKCHSHKEKKCSEKEEEKCNSHKEEECKKEEEKCNSDKEEKCCEKEEKKCCEKETCDSLCECKGVVNNFVTATNRITINICPNCKVKESSVFVQIGFIILKSTSVFAPKCTSVVGGTTLSASGLGEFILGSFFFEGSFTVLLFEQLGNNDYALFSFTGVAAGGTSIYISFLVPSIPDANLSITKCNSHGYEFGQSDLNVMPNVSLSPSDIQIKGFIHHIDGTIEEIEA